jgi:hypothetical protein
MKITLGSGDPLKLSTDLLVLLATEAEAFPKGKAASGLLGQLDSALGNHLRAAAAQEKFGGKVESTLELSTLGQVSADRVAVLGLGRRDGRESRGAAAGGGPRGQAGPTGLGTAHRARRPGQGPAGRGARAGGRPRARGLPLRSLPERQESLARAGGDAAVAASP